METLQKSGVNLEYVDSHEDLSVQPFQPEMNLESNVVESSE